MADQPNPFAALVEEAVQEDRGLTFPSPQRLLKEVSFERSRVMPPTALYVDGDDSLALSIYNSKANQKVKLLGRILTPAGTVQPFQTIYQVPDVSRGPNPFTFSLGEGYLLNVTVESGAGGTVRGQTLVQVGLRWAETPAGVRAENLICDYATDLFQPGWPPAALRSPVDGPGGIISYQQSNPAAGAGFTITVPAATVQRVRNLSFRMVTSATVANRLATITITDGTNTLYKQVTAAIQAASLTEQYSYTAGLGFEEAAFTANTVALALPDLPLYPGYQLQVTFSNIQAGDQISLIEYVVEEWIAP